MTQLVKNMYGSEFNRTGILFGLRCGQMRSDQVVKNAGWYNAQGERLGFGDLDTNDLAQIIDGLEDGEMFVTLSEQDSFWAFVTRPGLIGSMSSTAPTVEAPGIDYVASHARYVMAAGQLWRVDRYGTTDVSEVLVSGRFNQELVLVANVVKSNEVKALMSDPVAFAAARARS